MLQDNIIYYPVTCVSPLHTFVDIYHFSNPLRLTSSSLTPSIVEGLIIINFPADIPTEPSLTLLLNS